MAALMAIAGNFSICIAAIATKQTLFFEYSKKELQSMVCLREFLETWAWRMSKWLAICSIHRQDWIVKDP